MTDNARAGDDVKHEGRQERWIPTPTARDTSGRDYVRWACSCGATSEPFIDNGDCERDFWRHAGLDVQDGDSLLDAIEREHEVGDA